MDRFLRAFQLKRTPESGWAAWDKSTYSVCTSIMGSIMGCSGGTVFDLSNNLLYR